MLVSHLTAMFLKSNSFMSPLSYPAATTLSASVYELPRQDIYRLLKIVDLFKNTKTMFS